jgi:hypothetical protein
MDLISPIVELWKHLLDPVLTTAWSSLHVWRYAGLSLLTLTVLVFVCRKRLVEVLTSKPGREHDNNLFKDFLADLPSSGGIQFIGYHDFVGSFRCERLDDLHHFIDTWGNPEHEFIDPIIEAKRVELCNAISDFLSTAGQFTTLRGDGVQTIKLSSAQANYEHSDRLKKEASQLNKSAAKALRIYTEFVRLAKKDLLS